MTENQRDYLADLANQKGVRLSDTDEWSTARASEEIERLKALPDATFEEITEEQAAEIDQLTQHALDELHKWGFRR